MARFSASLRLEFAVSVLLNEVPVVLFPLVLSKLLLAAARLVNRLTRETVPVGATNGSEVVLAVCVPVPAEAAEEAWEGLGGWSRHSGHWLPSWHCVRVCGLILIISLTFRAVYHGIRQASWTYLLEQWLTSEN